MQPRYLTTRDGVGQRTIDRQGPPSAHMQKLPALWYVITSSSKYPEVYHLMLTYLATIPVGGVHMMAFRANSFRLLTVPFT